MTATTTTPERVEVEQRLRLMADQGDFGRKPDPDDIRRVAADMLKASAAEIERLEKAVEPVRHWYESDEHPARALADIIADVVADLQEDRPLALRALAAEAESARLREALERISECDPWDDSAGQFNAEIARAALAGVSKQEVADHG